MSLNGSASRRPAFDEADLRRLASRGAFQHGLQLLADGNVTRLDVNADEADEAKVESESRFITPAGKARKLLDEMLGQAHQYNGAPDATRTTVLGQPSAAHPLRIRCAPDAA